MKIFSGYVREQKRYTKNELKHIFSFDEAAIRAAGEKLTELLPNVHAFTYNDYKMMLTTVATT